MPIYDLKCRKCGKEFETIAGINDTVKCSCGGDTKRLITASGHWCGNEDAPWLKQVLEVVDKKGGTHCQDFLKNPTRSNYKAWMKGEGIRPLENGETRRKPDDRAHTKQMVDYCMRKRMQREAISI